MRKITALQASTSSNECFCLHLRRAARLLTRRYDEALRPLGLNSGQFSLLMNLAGGAGQSIGHLALRLAMDRTTLTAALKPLLRDGYVLVQASAADKRSKPLGLSPAGHGLLRRALPVWRGLQQQVALDMAHADLPGLRLQLRAVAAPIAHADI